MFNALGMLCTFAVGGWLLARLFEWFDTDGQVKAAMQKWAVSLFTRWTK
jgi:hypothetical protein